MMYINVRSFKLFPMLCHHPVIGFLYKGSIHMKPYGAPQDLSCAGVLESTKIYRLSGRGVIKISDIGKNYFSRADIEIPAYLVFRSGAYMIVSSLMLIGIFFGFISGKVHDIHDFAAFLNTDTNLIVPPQIGTEGTFAGNKSQFPYDPPEAFHQETAVFLPGPALPILISFTIEPCVVAGAGNPEHLDTLPGGEAMFLGCLLVNERIYKLETVYLDFFFLEDVNSSSNSNGIFF